MNCPVCSKFMVTVDFGGAQVEVCREGCKGLWFDWFELAKLNDPSEGAGEALQQALRYPRTNDGKRPRLQCPKCRMPMVAHKYDGIEQVNIDECYSCRGVFLDSGELKEIRHHRISSDEEDAYLQKLLSESSAVRAADNHLKALRAERDAAMRNWTRFLRLSYWSQTK